MQNLVSNIHKNVVFMECTFASVIYDNFQFNTSHLDVAQETLHIGPVHVAYLESKLNLLLARFKLQTTVLLSIY
jgi:hypothetical protein